MKIDLKIVAAALLQLAIWSSLTFVAKTLWDHESRLTKIEEFKINQNELNRENSTKFQRFWERRSTR